MSDAAERLRDLTSRLGFGDGITEPQADNDTIVAHIEAEQAAAAEWHEHQSWLNDCAEAGCDPLEDCPDHAPPCHPAHGSTGTGWGVKRLHDGTVVPYPSEGSARAYHAVFDGTNDPYIVVRRTLGPWVPSRMPTPTEKDQTA